MLLLLLYITLELTFKCRTTDLPPFLPRCCIDDPKLDDCLLDASLTLRPNIGKGIKEIGIPSYQPLIIPYFRVLQDSKALNFNVTLWNYTIRGLDNYDIKQFRYNPETLKFSGRLEFDPLSIDSIYDISGRLLYIPVNGNGTVLAGLGPVNGTFEITGTVIKYKNLQYYNPMKVEVRIAIDDINMYFGGLFDGNVEIANMANELISRNSKLITIGITPVFEQLTEKFLMRYMKWLTAKFPFDTLFPRCK